MSQAPLLIATLPSPALRNSGADTLSLSSPLPEGGFIEQVSLLPMPELAVNAVHCRFKQSRYTPDLLASWGIALPASLARVSAARQAQFLAGRYAACYALGIENVENRSPARRDTGEVIWPQGITGSISHCDDSALCVVGRGGHLGIDIEPLVASDAIDELWRLVGDDKEWQRLSMLPRDRALTLLFSAKESLYKALFPRLQRYIDFSEVRVIAVDPERRTLQFKPRSALGLALPRGCIFTVYWQWLGERCLSYTRCD